MVAIYSSKHRTTVFSGWNQGQHKGETFFLLLLQLLKKRKNIPEPLSKLLLACHGSEGGHMPTLGLASRYCGRKGEGGNGFWCSTKSKGYKLLQDEPNAAFPLWPRFMKAADSNCLSLHFTMQLAILGCLSTHEHCSWSQQGGFGLFPLRWRVAFLCGLCGHFILLILSPPLKFKL